MTGSKAFLQHNNNIDRNNMPDSLVVIYVNSLGRRSLRTTIFDFFSVFIGKMECLRIENGNKQSKLYFGQVVTIHQIQEANNFGLVVSWSLFLPIAVGTTERRKAQPTRGFGQGLQE